MKSHRKKLTLAWKWQENKTSMDTFTHVHASLYPSTHSLSSRMLVLKIELVVYTYVYNNYRLLTLPWDSPWTWYLCFLGVDAGFYWFHRATHGEIRLLQTRLIRLLIRSDYCRDQIIGQRSEIRLLQTRLKINGKWAKKRVNKMLNIGSVPAADSGK